MEVEYLGMEAPLTDLVPFYPKEAGMGVQVGFSLSQVGSESSSEEALGSKLELACQLEPEEFSEVPPKEF